jgi:uncharacterized protein YbaP (TraB family)
MAILRREFGLALALLPFGAQAAPPALSSRGPLFWVATRGKGRVFLLGFGDARSDDNAWFTPAIRHAFQHSSELWLEVAPPEASAGRDAAAKARDDAEYARLSHEPPGRTVFDELEPRARDRLMPYMAELGIKRESIEPLRPWWAYYTINRAFWSQTKLPYEPINVDQLLWKLATEQRKPVYYENPDGVTFAQHMAAMPQKAQSQYIEFLLNFLDDHKKGLDRAPFDWESGSATAALRSLGRMRTQLPDLYQAIQVQRNIWWARKIDALLSAGRTAFIAIGQLHMVGPDSIPNQLRRLKIVPPSHLRENPSGSL